jgi:hypothetical protein
LQESTFGPREYRIRAWQRALYIGLGAFLTGTGIFVWYATSGQTGKTGAVPIALALLPVCLGAYLLALAIRSRLIIDGSHIEVRGAVREQTAELSDVEGYRTVSTRNGSFWRFQLKQGRGSIQIQKWFDCDDLRAWLQQLTDLDERDRNALLAEIEQAQDLGTTPDERLNALKQANHLNIALSAVAIAAAVVFFFYQGPARPGAAIVLALIPAMVLYLMRKDPLLYTLGKPKRDPRSDLSIAALASGIGLMFGGIAMHFVSYKPLLLWGALIAAVYVFAFSAYTQRRPQVQGFVLIMLMYGCMYAYGLVTVTDTLLDHSPATTFATSIVGEHEVHGRSTTYYLDLAAWGPFDGTNKLSVPHSEYLRAQIGGAVCLSLHPGYLHAAWYTRVDCGDRFVVGPAQ